MDPYTLYLHQRWNDGCIDTAVLYMKIREQGFRGSVQILPRYLQPCDPVATVDGGIRRLPAPSGPRPRNLAVSLNGS